MNSQLPMDIFGEALAAYTNGDRNIFYLVDEKGRKNIYDLSERFRPYSKLNLTEKKLISLSHGHILDIGCGTGNVIPALEKKGRVVGIDISPKVIEVAHSRGCKNCMVADIFTFSPKEKFDTITLFGNDLGIGGTVTRTKKLLEKLKHLLSKNGQILAITRNFNHSAYKEMKLTPQWKNMVGPEFGWLIFKINFLIELCEEQDLTLEIISMNWKYRLIRITK